MSGFLSALSVTLVDDRKGLWRLDARLGYRSDVLKADVWAEQGFVTDFASGPMFGMLSLGRDIGRPIAGIHDWLYTARTIPRKLADQVLREGMLVLGYDVATADAFYAAVRLGGWWHWRKPDNAQPAHVNAALSLPIRPRSAPL